MRASRALAVTATACAAMALSTPLAVANSGPSHVTVNPHSVHQGGTIRITVQGCDRGGTVTSNAFPTVRLSQNRQGNDQNSNGNGNEQGNEQGNEHGNEQGNGNRPEKGNEHGNEQGNGNRPENGNEQGNGNRPEKGNEHGNEQGNGNRPENGNEQGNGNRPENGNHQGNENRPENGNQQGNENRPGNEQGDGQQNQAGRSSATARIYNNATPGHYNLAVRCNDNARTATARFTVLDGRGARGGVGGSLAPSSTEMAVGAGLVAVAAVGGSLFIVRRRRMSGGRI